MKVHPIQYRVLAQLPQQSCQLFAFFDAMLCPPLFWLLPLWTASQLHCGPLEPTRKDDERDCKSAFSSCSSGKQPSLAEQVGSAVTIDAEVMSPKAMPRRTKAIIVARCRGVADLCTSSGSHCLPISRNALSSSL